MRRRDQPEQFGRCDVEAAFEAETTDAKRSDGEDEAF